MRADLKTHPATDALFFINPEGGHVFQVDHSIHFTNLQNFIISQRARRDRREKIYLKLEARTVVYLIPVPL
jgi:hypothetical protein